MNTGNMRNAITIYQSVQTRNEVGEIIQDKSLFMSVKAEVQFEKVQESGSKFDASWSNRLVVKTRYSKSLMPVITNRSSFSIEFQGNMYSIKNYESWNHVQKYITFYIEKN